MTRRGAFTLIELMIVVAVIAILMALLVPTTRVVREVARRTKCSHNLHQIHGAVMDYTEDYHGHTPHATVLNISSAVQPSRPLYPGMLHNLLRPYIGGETGVVAEAMEVFHCPSDGPEEYFRVRYGSSYQTRGRVGCNNYPKPLRVPVLGQPLDDFPQPSLTGVVRDGRGWHRLSGKGGWTLKTTMGEQVVYLDGHVVYFGDVWGGAGGLP